MFDNTPIKMELDSGDAVSIMNLKDFRKIFPNKILSNSDIVLTTYCKNKLKVLRFCNVKVKIFNHLYELPLYVVDVDIHPLLGRECLNVLKLESDFRD